MIVELAASPARLRDANDHVASPTCPPAPTSRPRSRRPTPLAPPRDANDRFELPKRSDRSPPVGGELTRRRDQGNVAAAQQKARPRFHATGARRDEAFAAGGWAQGAAFRVQPAVTRRRAESPIESKRPQGARSEPQASEVNKDGSRGIRRMERRRRGMRWIPGEDSNLHKQIQSLRSCH